MEENNGKQKKITPSSTVIITRACEGEVQVYLIRRSLKSGFMAGNYVFPGGKVEQEDRDFEMWMDHVDLDVEAVSERFGGGLSASDALSYCVAAIRETLEEAGVFLGHADHAGLDIDGIEEFRAKGNPQGWFKKYVMSQGLTLALSGLSRWSHWITPELMKRRFDTRFFIASMPDGQVCLPDAREATHGIWISPRNGLEGNKTGEIPLSPPTLVTLHELLQYHGPKDLEQEVKSRGWGDVIMPRLVPLDKEGGIIVEPWDPEYGKERIEIDVDVLPKTVLPVGAPFSRIWRKNGLSAPVRCLTGRMTGR